MRLATALLSLDVRAEGNVGAAGGTASGSAAVGLDLRLGTATSPAPSE